MQVKTLPSTHHKNPKGVFIYVIVFCAIVAIDFICALSPGQKYILCSYLAVKYGFLVVMKFIVSSFITRREMMYDFTRVFSKQRTRRD